MKKLIWIVVILVIGGLLISFNKKDNDLKKVKVADTTLTSRTYK